MHIPDDVWEFLQDGNVWPGSGDSVLYFWPFPISSLPDTTYGYIHNSLDTIPGSVSRGMMEHMADMFAERFGSQEVREAAKKAVDARRDIKRQ